MFNLFKKRKQEQLAPEPVINPEPDKIVSDSEPKKPKKPRKPRVEKNHNTTADSTQMSPKELATLKGEPWVQVIGFELDPNNIGNGAIELDFNDIFVARLIKAGYRGKTDTQVVDQWFTDVCRNIVLETFEQSMADPERRPTTKRNLGGGRSEFS